MRAASGTARVPLLPLAGQILPALEVCGFRVPGGCDLNQLLTRKP